MTKVHLDHAHNLHLLKEMIRIRRFEEKCFELYQAQKIRGFLHLYDGEEAVSVGTMQALAPEDAVIATYHEHGQAIARGIPMVAPMAEMYGRLEGCCRGRGGSMHTFDRMTRFYGGNAIVGGGRCRASRAGGFAPAGGDRGRRAESGEAGVSEFVMPSLGADVEAGTLLEWLKKPGDVVKCGDVVAVVETQKGAVEIESLEAGVLERMLVQPGEKGPVGTPMATLPSSGAAQEPEPPPQPPPEVPPQPEPPPPVPPPERPYELPPETPPEVPPEIPPSPTEPPVEIPEPEASLRVASGSR